MSVDDFGTGFAVTVEAAAPIDAGAVCGWVRTAAEGMVAALESAPGTPVGRVGVLGAEERDRILREWNGTAGEVPAGTLPGLFEAQVARSPGAVAVVFEGAELTYGELNGRANRLARLLAGRGVGPESVVAVAMERSAELVVALLAVLKAGGAYLPVDPSYPAERVGFMLADARPVVVVTSQGVQQALPVGDGVARVVVDEPGVAAELAGFGDGDLSDAERGGRLLGGHPAYVIFTSGSTGRPKGVAVPHAGVVNRLAWMQDAFGLGAGDRVLQKTPFGFDVSVWEFFWPLLEGAVLVVARPGGHQEPGYLAELIRARAGHGRAFRAVDAGGVRAGARCWRRARGCGRWSAVVRRCPLSWVSGSPGCWAAWGCITCTARRRRRWM